MKKFDRPHYTKAVTERVNRLRDAYFNHVPSVDIERAMVYTRFYQTHPTDDLIVRRAKAFKQYLAEKTIDIYPDELIVGFSGKAPRSFVFCPDICWQWVSNELDTIDTREQDPYAITEEDRETIRNFLIPFWTGKSMEEYCLDHMTPEMKDIAVGTNIVFGENKSTVGGGETAVGIQDIVFKKGFKGIKAEAEEKLAELDVNDIQNYDKRQFYTAIITVCEAVKIMCDRYGDLALKQSYETTDEKRKAELLEISRICHKVPWDTPDTFQEAVQAVAFVEVLLYCDENCSGFNTGRIDQYLYPYYKADKAAGKINDTDALELLECLWLNLAQCMYGLSAAGATFYVGYNPYHGVTLGGIDENGNDASNELSMMGLQATMDLQLHTPTVNVRVNPKSSDAWLGKICDLVRQGTGQPAVHFDPAAFEMLRRNKVDEKELWNYTLVGCVSPQMAGETTQWNEGSRFSYPIAVDLALFDGYCHTQKKQLGPHTGDPATFKTYEEFEKAVEIQLRHVVAMACKCCQINERAQQLYLPKPLRDCLVHGPVEKGIDIMYPGSSKYFAGPGLLATGIADLADSMAAVKKLVYETKEISMADLVHACDTNFEGNEAMRQKLIKDAPKYGNDDPYVDDIAEKFDDISVNEAEKFRSIFGSKYMVGMVPVMANVPHGQAVWAIPSGRKAMAPLADGISPFPGADQNGPTSIIKSVCRLHHGINGAGTLLNMKLTPQVLATEEGKKKFIALLRSECALGGYHIQFNVVDKKTLLDAQAHPEQHADLLVRVAGYSAFFVDLRKDAQDLIINRSEIASL